uniref:Uncharacterized protein n=1 Tax=Nelumbo nucifera TaxID=4432 RepID=A0A822Y029_NELNU|nr:TPA_asm: hypothetical protein HUJ06_028732 [Nelumbo nucifera]
MHLMHGEIPSSIGDMSGLWALDFSYNNFSGEIPEHLAKGWINLGILSPSNNSLHGQIFPMYFNLTSLLFLAVDNNQFSGNILDGLSKCTQLSILDMSNNQISGKIPSWFLNFTSLDTLVMRDNLLDGQFPIGFSSIQFLDLSGNQFSCSIPSSPELNYMHLQRNRFTGSLPSLLLNSSSLMSLDLGYNNSGGIPSWIGELSELRVLLLKENNFSGPIPEQLCQLNRTLFMDLSLNNFVGSIPQCLNNISFGRIDDMEYPFYPRYSGDWCVKIIFLVDIMSAYKMDFLRIM